jgi:glutamine cyclotransferase
MQDGRRTAYMVFVRKPERGQLKGLNIDGDNIKMNTGEIGQEDVKLIDLTQGRIIWQTLVKKVMKQGVA